MDCDVVVVGAGPVGLEVAAVLKADGLSTVNVDSGAIGATISRCFPPQTRFFTSPERLQLYGQGLNPLNQEKLTGEEYLAYLRSYVQTHQLRVRTFETVTAIDSLPSGDLDSNLRTRFRLTLQARSGRVSHIDSNFVVLATGGTDVPRRLGIPGEDLDHVHTMLGDPHQYANRRVLVVGGRNSAAESALRCYRVGAEVHLVHRKPQLNDRIKFWIKPEVESLMVEGRIVQHMPDGISRIDSDYVTLQSGKQLEVDDVVLQLGFEQDRAIFDLAGVDTQGESLAPSFDTDTMQTNRPGIFVAGTATAGTQDAFGVFIENSHDHGHRIAASIAGRQPPPITPPRPLPEV